MSALHRTPVKNTNQDYPKNLYTAEKLSKTNNVADPGWLENNFEKYKTKPNQKNPLSVLSRYYRCVWHGSCKCKVQKGANIFNMSSSGTKFWTATQTS